MKKIIGAFALLGLLIACKSNNHYSSSRITLSKEPATYIKDRKLLGPIEQSVDPQGASGPGLGSSYASRSYRQSSIMNSENGDVQGGDSISLSRNQPYEIIKSPQEELLYKNRANINCTDRWDRNLINKYENRNKPDITSLHSCYWRPPLRENYCSIE